MVKEKLVAEDDARKGEESVQSITDENMKSLDALLVSKEKELMEI